MTSGLFEPDHWIDATPDMVRRTLDLARHALRARECVLVPTDNHDDEGACLTCPVGADEAAFATLVVRDAPERRWSDDDRAILADLAALLGAEIVSRRERDRERTLCDHHPGLVFERREAWPARAECTVFGALRDSLPALRALIEGGTNEDALGAVHIDDREAVRRAMMRGTLAESELDLVFRIEDRDGAWRWLRCQSVARREIDGALVWSGACSDVTDLVSRLKAPEDVTRPVGTTAAASTGTSATEGSGGLILLADDLDLNRKLISDMLSFEGYVVDSVADGAAAVEAAKAKAYDLILMDMIMPGMDGMDATRAIRALPAPACDVPIVALTAHSFREQLDNCLDAGMNATLTKPMSFDALTEAVSTWTKSRPQAA